MFKNNLYRLLLVVGIVITFCSVVHAQNFAKIDWDEKEAEFFDVLQATDENQTEAELHQAMGDWLLEEQKQEERAIVHYKKAVELDPALYNSWYTLGLLFISTEEGNEFFRKAIKANPNHAPSYYWLAYNACRNGKDAEATPLFEKYLTVAKDDGPSESDRLQVARDVLKELRSGKDGEEVRKIKGTKRAVGIANQFFIEAIHRGCLSLFAKNGMNKRSFLILIAIKYMHE